jgi:hypothetical protein
MHFLKAAQVRYFRPLFLYIGKSCLGRRLRDWKICFILKTEADIRHFVFVAHGERKKIEIMAKKRIYFLFLSAITKSPTQIGFIGVKKEVKILTLGPL